MHLGVDLGSSGIRLYLPGKGVVLCEPTLVALDPNSHKILAFGEQALHRLARTPSRALAIRPMRDGVIADYAMTEALLRHCIQRVAGRGKLFRPQVMIGVHADVTSVEKRTVLEAALSAGAGRAYLIETPIAAAVGAGLKVEASGGLFVLDIGGGTTDVAVISLGGIVVSQSIRMAGNKMDEAIIRYLRKNYNLMIGERTAETIKIRIGSAWSDGRIAGVEIRGRDLIDGMPKTRSITSDEIREALEPSARAIVTIVKTVLESTPPDLLPDLARGGITLTGGGSLLRGMDTLLAEATGMTVRVADDPISCVAIGAGLAESLR